MNQTDAKNVLSTPLANDLDATDGKTRYDAQIKKVLANKIILSWIMKHTMKEFEDLDISDIAKCIEGDIDVATIPIEPGLTNLTSITGESNENAIPNEGKVTFDIRFHVILPEGKRTKMIINIEAQKDSSPGYDLVPRGIFYCARLLSSQLDQEFTNKSKDSLKYDGIKKVYSIWICMDSLVNEQNSIVEYHMVPNTLFNEDKQRTLKAHRHDLLSVVMIYLGDNSMESDNQLVSMLTTLLSSDITKEKKKQILQDTYNIPMTIEYEQEVDDMCNLSEYVEQKGIQKGLQKGLQEGLQEGLQKGLQEGKEQAKIDLAKNKLNSYSDETLADLYELDLKVVQELRRKQEQFSRQ